MSPVMSFNYQKHPWLYVEDGPRLSVRCSWSREMRVEIRGEAAGSVKGKRRVCFVRFQGDMTTQSGKYKGMSSPVVV